MKILKIVSTGDFEIRLVHDGLGFEVQLMQVNNRGFVSADGDEDFMPLDAIIRSMRRVGKALRKFDVEEISFEVYLTNIPTYIHRYLGGIRPFAIEGSEWMAFLVETKNARETGFTLWPCGFLKPKFASFVDNDMAARAESSASMKTNLLNTNPDPMKLPYGNGKLPERFEHVANIGLPAVWTLEEAAEKAGDRKDFLQIVGHAMADRMSTVFQWRSPDEWLPRSKK